MANLKVNFAGLQYANPVVVASGPTSMDAESIRKAVEDGAAGAVTKTISSEVNSKPMSNMKDFDGKYFLNAELWSQKSAEDWVEKEFSKCKIAGEPLIVGVGYTPEDIKKIVPLVDKYADAYEISTHYIGRNLAPILETFEATRKYTKKPVFVKLSPGIQDVSLLARTLEEAGVSGLVAINTVGPCLSIDIETGNPHMETHNGCGWMSGPAIKPIAVRHVYELAKAVRNIPVFAVGGITSGKDVVEMMMAGATAVQVCTQSITEGTQVFGRIVKELNDWMDSHNYKSLEDIRGITLKKLKENKKK
ncbi:MAG: dihydroorotate dehydrogenase [Fusobacteriaceae bacterium]